MSTPLAAYSASEPNVTAIQAAAAASKPPGTSADYVVAAEAMLRAGGLFYWKTNYAPCGASAPPPSGFTSGQIVGLSGSAASGVIGGIGAAGVISAPLTLGISAAVSLAVAGIEDIFAHHAQAVANEQNTICSVANYFNNAKYQIDQAVRSGAISPDAAVSYLLQVANQAKSGLATIAHPCNAACVYQGFVQAFMNYARTFYDSIAPALPFAQNPGGPPTSYGTPPGGVTTSPGALPPAPPLRSLPQNTYIPANPSPIPQQGTSPPLTVNNGLPGNPRASDYLNLGYNQQTGQSGQAADIANPAVFPQWALPLVALILIILVIDKVAF